MDAALEAVRRRAQAEPGDESGQGNGPAQSTDDAARVAAAGVVLALIDQWPAEAPAEDLIKRTLARIHDVEQRRQLAMQIDRLSGPAVAFRWRELMGVAAVVLISLSLLWPVLAQTRHEARRIVCETRLGVTGRAMAAYATDHQGIIPRLATAPNANWATVGRTATAGTNPGFSIAPSSAQSNPASLYLLARKQYVDPDTMSCPDNAFAPKQMSAGMHDWRNAREVSFSYQNQNTLEPIRLDAAGNMPLLADKNPIFMPDPSDPSRVIYQRTVSPTSATPFHRSAGQNILTGSGQVRWSSQPIVDGDNIWLIRGQGNYSLTETPPTGDAFLVP